MLTGTPAAASSLDHRDDARDLVAFPDLVAARGRVDSPADIDHRRALRHHRETRIGGGLRHRRYLPPSEKLSGVMFTMPITCGTSKRIIAILQRHRRADRARCSRQLRARAERRDQMRAPVFEIRHRHAMRAATIVEPSRA
jgi:hypothetical protein